MSVHNVSLPETKAEIEQWVVTAFLRSGDLPINKPFLFDQPLPISEPQPNPEQDFDFTVTGLDGPAYLELKEIAPLDLFGPTFEKAPAMYNGYDLAQNIAGMILKKSKGYADPAPKALYLLVYVTHWSFSLSDTVVRLVQYELARHEHKFCGVFDFQPIDNEQGLVHRLYPVPPELLQGFDPELFKDHKVLNLDYQKFTMKTQSEVTFNYQKADGFTTSYVDGAFASPMPSGNVYVAFFIDWPPIPQSSTQQLLPGGQLGAQTSSVVSTAIDRELQTGIIISPTTARNLISLLQGFVSQLENQSASQDAP